MMSVIWSDSLFSANAHMQELFLPQIEHGVTFGACGRGDVFKETNKISLSGTLVHLYFSDN